MHLYLTLCSFILRVERSSTKTNVAPSAPASAAATGIKTAAPHYKEDSISIKVAT